MITEKIYTIILAIGVLLILSLVYHKVYRISVRNILRSILWIWGIWSMMLIANSYAPTSITPGVIILWVIAWLINKQYLRTFFLLSTILILLQWLQYFWMSTVFLSIILVVSIEEIVKSAWIITYKKNVLPYDAILWGILLWSFFWIFEAWRAWRIDTVSQVRMRISSTMSIHTVATTSIIWLWVYWIWKNTIKNITYISAWILVALTIHWWYNYFQSNIVISVAITLSSYLLLTYWISKVDRIIIQ